MSRRLRVLALQPYFGGSHKHFHESWVSHSRHDWTTLSLPSRHWKWRMRHASIFFNESIRERVIAGESWDLIFCTDMLNVAEFKGLIASNAATANSVSKTPIVVYFHENQFAYPIRPGHQPDQHFPFTNFMSILAADEAWFNSQFNFDSMQEGLKRHAARWPDFKPTHAIESLPTKVKVQHLGIEQPPIDIEEYARQRSERNLSNQPLRIVWAARWEHDKNPEDLLEALRILKSQEVPFQLSVLGQSFANSPSAFEEIKKAFQVQILRWGFQETRQQYWEALAECDVYVSTANHEFFGLAAAEAIAAGLYPLFPNRLAYPELLKVALKPTIVDASINPADHDNDTARGAAVTPSQYLYEGSAASLASALHVLSSNRPTASTSLSTQLMSHLNLPRRSTELDDELVRVTGDTKSLRNL